MTSSLSSSSASRERGFTLIELLTVIAIIGILAGIIIPTVGKVRESAKKTKTRVQFTQWAAGVRLFKQTYGYYPRFASNGKVNGALTYNGTALGTNDYLFRELLGGKGAKPNGTSFDFDSAEKDSSSSIQNRKRQQFVSFDAAEITSRDGVDAGDSEVMVDNALKDAFGNVEIVVLVDRNSDGLINTADLPSGASNYPEVIAKGGKGTLTAARIKARVDSSDPSGNGVRGDVIFYSPGRGTGIAGAPANAIAEGDAVWSW